MVRSAKEPYGRNDGTSGWKIAGHVRLVSVACFSYP